MRSISRAKKVAPWSIGNILRVVLSSSLVGILLLVGLTTITFLLSQLLGIELPKTALVSVICSATYAAVVVNVWYFVLKKYGLSWSALGLRPVRLRTLLAMIPLYFGVLCLYFLLILLVFFMGGRPPESTPYAVNHTMSITDYGWGFLAAVIAAPVAEEIFFRGVLFPYLRSRMRVLSAAVLSAAIFALCHPLPFAWPMLIALGIVLALVTEHCQSIYPAMVLHGLNNTFALTTIYLTLS